MAACVARTAEGEVWTGKLEWLDETSRTIKDVVMAAAATNTGDTTAPSEAADWLRDYLTLQSGSADSAVIRAEGRKAGHSKDALRRAKNTIGVTSTTTGFPRRAFWALPKVGATSGESAPNALTASTALTEGQWAHSAQRAQWAQTPRATDPTGSEGDHFGISDDVWTRHTGSTP